MSIYLPNFNDQRIIDFCGAFGATVDGFYNKLGALGYTGSIDDRWKAYLTARYGYFNGLHVNGYVSEEDFAFYAGHNAVTFDGTNDYLYLDATAPLAGFTALDAVIYGTVVIQFSVPDTTPAATNRLFYLRNAAAGALGVFLTTNGDIVFYSLHESGAGWGAATAVTNALLQVNTLHTLQFNFTDSTVTGYLDGVSVLSTDWSNGEPGALDFSTFEVATIGSSAATLGTALFTGTMSLAWAWFGEAADSANAALAADPTKFYSGGDVDLGTDGTLSGAPAPWLFLGGSQSPGDFNAGINQGTGPDLGPATNAYMPPVEPWYTPISFNGDSRLQAAAPFTGATVNKFTFSASFTAANLTTDSQVLFELGGRSVGNVPHTVLIVSSSYISFSWITADYSQYWFYDAVLPAGLTSGQHHILIAADDVANNNEVYMWIDGVLQSNVGYGGNFTALPRSVAGQTVGPAIGGLAASTDPSFVPWEGSIGHIWLNVSDDIRTPRSFLSIEPVTGVVAGLTPDIYFGGPDATVSEWTAGDNKGADTTTGAWAVVGSPLT